MCCGAKGHAESCGGGGGGGGGGGQAKREATAKKWRCLSV